jgi:excisionase family DNA binding protein
VQSESQARLSESVSSTPLLLTIPEVADELRVDKRTVYRLLRSGELDLPVIRVGSSPRVRRLDLEQHLARLAADEKEAVAVRRDRAALLLRPQRRLPTGRR